MADLSSDKPITGATNTPGARRVPRHPTRLQAVEILARDYQDLTENYSATRANGFTHAGGRTKKRAPGDSDVRLGLSGKERAYLREGSFGEYERVLTKLRRGLPVLAARYEALLRADSLTEWESRELRGCFKLFGSLMRGYVRVPPLYEAVTDSEQAYYFWWQQGLSRAEYNALHNALAERHSVELLAESLKGLPAKTKQRILRKRAETQGTLERTCPSCGRKFTPLRLTAEYCRDACRKRAFEKRKRGR